MRSQNKERRRCRFERRAFVRRERLHDRRRACRLRETLRLADSHGPRAGSAIGLAGRLEAARRGDFLEECVDLWDELDEPLGDEDDAEVLALLCAQLDGVGKLVDDLRERKAPRLDLFGDERHVGLGEIGALECDVAR